MAVHKGGCHCGAVRFEFRAPGAINVTDCNCSMCGMTGYEHVFVPQADLRFLSGANALTEPRSHPEAWSVNLRCVDAGTLRIAKRIPFDGQDWEGNIAALKEQT